MCSRMGAFCSPTVATALHFVEPQPTTDGTRANKEVRSKQAKGPECGQTSFKPFLHTFVHTQRRELLVLWTLFACFGARNPFQQRFCVHQWLLRVAIVHLRPHIIPNFDIYHVVVRSPGLMSDDHTEVIQWSFCHKKHLCHDTHDIRWDVSAILNSTVCLRSILWRIDSKGRVWHQESVTSWRVTSEVERCHQILR